MRRLSTADPGFEADFTALLGEARETTARVDQAVSGIIADVRARGDAALLDYTARFDRLTLTQDRLRITKAEIDAAVAGIAPDPDGRPRHRRNSHRIVPSQAIAR